jgi:hypothetical protein
MQRVGSIVSGGDVPCHLLTLPRLHRPLTMNVKFHRQSNRGKLSLLRRLGRFGNERGRVCATRVECFQYGAASYTGKRRRF